MDFAIPETLPGGFRLEQVYTLRFGPRPGIAAAYTRGDEFLATIFHKPLRQEDHGSHRDYPCVVGQHRGHKVVVGRWKLVHLTDETTCHCVLSTLDEDQELPAVMKAIAPGVSASSVDPYNRGIRVQCRPVKSLNQPPRSNKNDTMQPTFGHGGTDDSDVLGLPGGPESTGGR